MARILLHLGEVRAQEGRLYGTGVNLAARLEPLAEPGGICLSAELHREVSGRTHFAFRDLGEQQVKNIPEPVYAYAVELPGASAAMPTRQRGWPVAAGIVLLVGLFVLRPLMRLLTTPTPQPEHHHAALATGDSAGALGGGDGEAQEPPEVDLLDPAVLRNLADLNPERTVEIIRNWLQEEA